MSRTPTTPPSPGTRSWRGRGSRRCFCICAAAKQPRDHAGGGGGSDGGRGLQRAASLLRDGSRWDAPTFVCLGSRRLSCPILPPHALDPRQTSNRVQELEATSTGGLVALRVWPNPTGSVKVGKPQKALGDLPV